MNQTPGQLAKRPYKTLIEKVWDKQREAYVYITYHEEFGKLGCRGEGLTADAALDSLDAERLDVISILVSKGKPVPEPELRTEPISVSGHFPVRTSPIIHQRLLRMARRMKISLNALVNQLLVQNLTCTEMEHYLDNRLRQTEYKIDRNYREIRSIHHYQTQDSELFDLKSWQLDPYHAVEEMHHYAIAS